MEEEQEEMKTMEEVQGEIVGEFGVYEDWIDRYSLLIEMGGELGESPASKTEGNLLEGCQSRVWLEAEYREGRVYFKGEGEALIVRGIVALLIRVLSGRTPEEILEGELTFIEGTGLGEHLSPTRSNGLRAMVKRMRMYALAFKEGGGEAG
jgi:cysteine desulfuration protein SufE